MIDKTEEQIMNSWIGEKTKPVVSVRCMAYNHADYIAKALDGFLAQKTTFPFEIIVHDDASTDGTTRILREYAKKYPHIIAPIIETENQFKKNNGVIEKAINETIRGNYIAYCDGDDYWNDPDKLQIQYEYMESHPECALCTHNTIMHNLLTNKESLFFEWKEPVHILTPDEVFFDWNVHLSSYFIHRELVTYRNAFPRVWCGDYVMLLCAFSKGTVAALNRVMSCYNFNNQNGITWENKLLRKNGPDKEEKRYDFLVRFNELTNYKYDDCVQRRLSRVQLDIILHKRLSIDSYRSFRNFRKDCKASTPYNKWFKELSWIGKMKEVIVMNSYLGLRSYLSLKSRM